MELARGRYQGQVAVLAAIKTRLGVTAHDALQQHPTRHLQAPAFKEPGSAHHFAAGHAIEIGGDAFNFIDTRQLLRERALAIACHATFLVVEQAAEGNDYKIRTACSEFQAGTAQIPRKQ